MIQPTLRPHRVHLTRRARTSLPAVVAVACLGWLASVQAACGTPSETSTADRSEADSATSASPPARPDVVLVTLDTLRADSLGFVGQDVETPLLDRMAREGVWFRRAYAHNVVTLPSHANLLTGLYPHQHGVRENSGFVLSGDVPTLATRLRDVGYATGAFVGAYPLDSRFGLDRGFQVYDDSYSLGLDPRNPSFPERRGDEVVAAALDWWRSNDDAPRFLWVHLYDPHAPYDAPEPWGSRYGERAYLGEVAATDAFLKPLLEPIFDGPPESTLVVVTSDHGEGLGEHGETTHGLFVYEPTLRVPLILWGAGVAATGAEATGSETAGVDVETPVGHVDVAPTIYELLGLEADDLPGRSLLRPAASRDTDSRQLYFEALSAYFNRGWAPLRGVVAGDEKLIELPLPEFYDLVDDPAERRNLVQPRAERYRALRRDLPGSDWPPGREELDSEEIEALRALGYVTEEAPRKDVYTAEDDPKSLIHLDRMYHEAVDAYHRGNLQKAEALTRRILAERADMTNAYSILVMTLREAGRPEAAIEVLETAVADGLATDEMLGHLGATYAEVGRTRRAIEVLGPLEAEGQPTVLATLGIAHSDAGDHARARALLERLLAEAPDDTQGHENYGVVLLRLQKPADAQTHFERALELNEGLPFAWNNLGVARAWQGDERGAMEAWQRAIALDPNLLDALYNLGLTAAKLGEPDVARRALERYVEVAPPGRFAADIRRARQVLEGLP